ncbi:protein GVQW3-like [Ruditapes philippinarum]|uniref:protein GVQW3-like n=1 Tax=Ruditapes philippinarum TaxID=129788 RepID=UPI00295B2087|nr:protein GVQW3-like [Ruditapes philippinarum]
MTSTDYAEHRTIIKFCVNLGKTPTQTQKMLETAKVRPLVCRSLVFKWHKRFRDGREDIEDDKGRGRKSTLTAASIKEVKDVIDRDRRYNAEYYSRCTTSGYIDTIGVLS